MVIKKLNSTFNKENVGNCHYKDCSLQFLLKHNPKLHSVITEIKPYFKDYEYITFDYQELNVNQNTPSCRNINWHTDGKDNEYLIICWGDSRTEFLDSSNHPLELEEQHLYHYTSLDQHRGRLLVAGQYRVFLRVCFSNYVIPRNKILKQSTDKLSA